MVKFFREWIVPVIIAAALALIIHNFIFFIVDVPTTSMYPTITPGDKIFVTKTYRQSSIERGDILVFHSKELGKDLIKRVVGLPGETVEVNGSGEVFINGEYLEEPYVSSTSGVKGSFTIPDDCYLFMGDNRADSKDARYWEESYINFDDIKGEARFVIFPFTRIGALK